MNNDAKKDIEKIVKAFKQGIVSVTETFVKQVNALNKKGMIDDKTSNELYDVVDKIADVWSELGD